jgi:phosphate transport system substrate-binding protein
MNVTPSRSNRSAAVLGLLAIGLGLTFGGVSCKESDSSSAGGGGGQVSLVGQGATFPATLYTQWFKDYNAAHPDVTIEYQGTGSSAGIKQFTAGTTDFGASDAAMTDKEIAAVQGGVILLPMTAGEVVLTYNIDGVTDLKLSRDALVGIFMGTIKKWNDPAIASANPGVNLPAADITPVHRADGSGTTFIFTTHLGTTSDAWKNGPGVGKTANWPGDAPGGTGNNGVTAQVKQTPNSIGYIEYGYALANNLPMAELENKAGKYVKPSAESGAAALASVKLPDDLRAWAPDPDGDDSYPIVSYTWLLVHPNYTDAAKAKALKDVIDYGLTDGQTISTKLGYIPLPDSVVTKVKAAAEGIKSGS